MTRKWTAALRGVRERQVKSSSYSCIAVLECPACSSGDFSSLLRWKVYTVNLCRSCELVLAAPLPTDEELTKFYQGFLFKKPHIKSIRKLTKRRKRELQRLFDLSDGQHIGRRFLDHGGGTGLAFNAAQQLKFAPYYQDLDEDAIAFTQQNFGLAPECTIRSLRESMQTFHYIFSDNVIEHAKDPKAFLVELLSKLEPGGTIVIKTPHARNTEVILNPVVNVLTYFRYALKYNSFGRSVRAYLKRFWHCDPPRHLYSFSRKSFHALMNSLNRNDLDYSIGFYEIPLFHNTMTQQFFSPDKRLKGIKSVLVRIALLPVLPIEVVLQSLKWLLVNARLLSRGGLILTIHKR